MFFKTFITLSVIIFPVLTGKIDKFKDMDAFFRFYMDWVNSESATSFQEMQNEWIGMLANKTVNPCDDFYEYACGNFKNAFRFDESDLRRDPRHSLRYGVPEIGETVMFEFLARIIQSDIQKEDSSMLKKVKQFYEMCVNEANHTAEMIKYIENVAAWPTLTENWDESQFDWVNVSATTEKLSLGSFIWGRVELRNGVRRNTFGRYNGHDGTMYDLKNMDLKIPKSILDKMDLSAVRQFSEELRNLKRDGDDENELTLDDLKDIFPNIDFQKYLQVMHNTSYIPDTEVVIIKDMEYHRNISNILLQTDVETIANFMFIDYMGKVTDSGGPRLTNDPEICTHMIFKLLIPVPAVTFMEKFHIKEDSVNEIHDIFSKLLDETKRTVSKWSTATFNDRWVDAYQLNVPRYTQLKEMIAADMESVHINRNSFIESLQSVMDYKKATSMQVDGSGGDFNYPLETTITKGTLKLNVIHNVFAGFLPPLFHRYAKLSMKYSGIAEMLSEKLVDEFIDLHLPNNLIDPVRCYFTGLNESKRNMDESVKSALKKIVGLSVAYKTYLHEISKDTRYRSAERNPLHLNERQSFFLAFTQRTCGGWYRARGEKSNGFPDTMDVLLNSAEFSNAFNCPLGSNMNPKKQC